MKLSLSGNNLSDKVSGKTEVQQTDGGAQAVNEDISDTKRSRSPMARETLSRDRKTAAIIHDVLYTPEGDVKTMRRQEVMRLVRSEALRLNEELYKIHRESNRGRTLLSTQHERIPSQTIDKAMRHQQRHRSQQWEGTSQPPSMLVVIEDSTTVKGAKEEVSYTWESTEPAKGIQPLCRIGVYRSINSYLRAFETEMMWTLRWMIATWETLSRRDTWYIEVALGELDELDGSASTDFARSELQETDQTKKVEDISINHLDGWHIELSEIERKYRGAELRRREPECRFEDWYTDDGGLTSDDLNLLMRGAKAYRNHRIEVERDRWRQEEVSESEVNHFEETAWGESHDPCETNMIQLEKRLEREQSVEGLEITFAGNMTLKHKLRIAKWLRDRAEDAARGSQQGEAGLKLARLGVKEMSIGEMLNRWSERFKESQLERKHGTEYRMWSSGSSDQYEAWLWAVDDSDSLDGDKGQSTYEGSKEEQRSYHLERLERAGLEFQRWLCSEQKRSPFEEVSDLMREHYLYRQWRRESTEHLWQVSVQEGRAIWRDQHRAESEADRASRMHQVKELWKVENDNSDYYGLWMSAKQEHEALRQENSDEECEVARLCSPIAESLTKKPSSMRDLMKGIDQKVREYYEPRKTQRAQTLGIIQQEVASYHERLEAVKRAKTSFSELFGLTPKWDMCNQHVNDTLMLLSVMINDRMEREGFETVRVMTVEQVENTDWKIIQLESEDLAKTEVALAEYHKSHLTALLPELRPDKFPEELWALTRTDRKQEAHDAWKLFSDKRLEEVVPRMMKIDISRETAARRREEPYLRAQILCNIDTWVYPDEDNPPMIEGFEYSINLTDPRAKPFKCKQRRYSVLERFSLRARCLNMFERKKIQNSTSEWASPPRLVAYDDRIKKFLEEHKENTMEVLQSIGTDRKMRDTVQNLYRFTSDMRKVNEVTKLEVFPLPNIPELINKCHGKDRYSCLDLEDAFFVVRCAPESRHLTAFLTPDGLFEYLVMVQGGKSSANVFAKIVSEVFQPLQDMAFLWYQDDLVNHEDGDIVAHMEMQEKIHTQCRKYKMILKPSKAHLNFTTQRVLGYIVSKEGRRVDPSLVEAITKLAPPKTLQGIQSLLGLAQVAREYIPAMATVIAPLQALARKNIDIEKVWDPKIHGVAFENLKAILTSSPVLLIPDVTKKFRVHVDCCRVGRGCGAVLLQENSRGEWQPVAYWSRALTMPERKMSATALEATAMHDAILHWKVYLTGGQSFDVITDHYALVYMITKMGGDVHGRMSRMITDLQGFTFSVTHRSGSLHLDADAISRLLQVDEEPYINGADDLRDDFGPLTAEQKHSIFKKYPKVDDADRVISTIDNFRSQRLTDPTVDSRKSTDTLHEKKKAKLGKSKISVSGSDPNGEEDEEGPKDENEEEAGNVNQTHQWAMQQEEEKHLGIKAMVEMPAERWAQDLLQVAEIECIPGTEDEEMFWIKAEHEEICEAWRSGALTDYPVARIEMVTQESEEGDILLGHRVGLRWLGDILQVNAGEIESDDDAEEGPERHQESPEQGTLRRSDRIRKLEAQQSARRAVEVEMRLQREEEAAARVIEKRQAKEERARNKREAEAGVHHKLLNRTNKRADAQLARLSDFNHLVMRHFLLEGYLYEIINTYQDHGRDKFMAMAQMCDDEKKIVVGNQEAEHRILIPIEGEQGAKALVQQYEESRSPLCSNDVYPKSDRDWLRAQNEDESLSELLQECARKEEDGVGSCVIEKGQRKEKTYERRRMQLSVAEEDELSDPILGPIKRVTVLNHGDSAGNISMWVKVMQILVPLQYRRRCLIKFHEELGHPGVKRMLKTIARTYFWDDMKEDVKRYVTDCHYCRARKVDTHRTKPPSQKYTWPVRPFYRIHMDITELTTTTTGYRYVLVIKDALTKWIELIPLRTKTASEVVEAFIENVVLRHGVPVTLITDKGSENCNQIMDDVIKLLDCEHVNTTPYNPRSDGLVENQMRTLKDQLASWTNKFHNDWDKHLQKVAHAYRVTVNDATGFTPYYMNHGRECNTPAENHLGDMDIDETTEKLHDYAEELRTTLLAAWELTAARVVKNVEAFNRVPRRHLEFEPYAVGQYVFVKVIPKRVYSEGYKKKKHKLSSKLQHRYVGPFRITRKFNDVLYEADIHNKFTRIHAVNMKPV